MSQSYNPYAAPAGGPAGPEGPGELGVPQPWAVFEVMTTAWETLKRQPAPLVISALIAGAISAMPQQIPAILRIAGVLEKNSPEYWTVFGITLLIGQVLGAFVNGGLVKVYLDAARGRTPNVSDVLSGGRYFGAMLGSQILMFLVTFFGLLALIVPGVILALGLSLTHFYIVDRDMGAVAAMRASWEAMKGHKGKMFVFVLAAIGVMLLGALACCLGTLAATPTVGVASAIIYLRISGSGAKGAEPTYIPPPSPYGQAPIAAPPPGSPYGY